MTKLNIEIKENYLDAINIFKITHKNEIAQEFGNLSQTTAVQYILKDYMNCKGLSDLSKLLDENEKSEEKK
jgi:hypothetical protein